KGLTVEQGAFVAEVTAGTEAEKAGIQPDDVIVKLDETPIRSMDELILAVRRMRVGDTVTLTLYRDGKQTTVEMKIGVKPKDL
ncbi:MAG TPA: PDZ domain-containing protein, partial [Coriobacteriia bacterium]|nr:PDZ domain-containing protein [Coriobacteriia bacterium]